MLNTRTLLAAVSLAALAACSHSERMSAQPATTTSAAVAVPTTPTTAVIVPGTSMSTVTPGAVSGSSLAATPIGSPKFGVTTDCNGASGGTVQGRTSATTMLDCGALGASPMR
jgi:hypothetical protein